MQRAGLSRLGDVVRSLGPPIPSMQLEAQGSSLGVYDRRWLEHFYLVAAGYAPQGYLPLTSRYSGPWASKEFTERTGLPSWPSLRILFPTERYVRNTFVEGPDGAGSFFSKPDDFVKRELRPLFYQPVSNRGDVLMHAKCLLATGPEHAGWVYLGSANFTRAAWGTLAGKPDQPTQSINNWEMGVVLPLDSPDLEGSAWDAVPYRRPVEAYGVSDLPWSANRLAP